jgi:hypothetical protein
MFQTTNQYIYMYTCTCVLNIICILMVFEDIQIHISRWMAAKNG